MRPFPFVVLGVALAWIPLGSTALAFAPPVVTTLELPLEWESAPVSFRTQAIEPLDRAAALAPEWTAQVHPRTGLVHVALGGSERLADAVVREAEAESLARTFLLDRAALLGTREDNLRPLVTRHARGKWVSHFSQVVDGVPVWRAKAFVLMGDDGHVIAFGSDFVPESHVPPASPVRTAADALRIAASALGTEPRSDRPVTTSLYYVPVPRGEHLELLPAHRVVFEASEPFGRWETFVEAVTGEILGRRNLYHTVNVIGSVDGDVQNQPPTLGWCDGSALEPLAHLTVAVQGGDSTETDPSGSFTIPHGGSTDVTVEAQLRGPFSDVDRYAGLGTDASFSGTATPGVPFPITWDAVNSRQDERTTFFHANVVHDFMTALDPTFTQLDYSMPSTVGRTDGFCPGNAWWDGFGMNYCEESVAANRANTGELGNVIYHEFGHGVTQEVYLRNLVGEPPGDLHEGNSDVIANFLDRNSVIGLGFFLSSCTSGIRDADNTKTYPESLTGEGHADGEIIAGFHWDAWQSMLGAMPSAAADSIAFHTWHLARDMGLPFSQPDQVLWTFLMDDDDSFVNNGTPNHEHFCLAAQNHGFDCPPIVPLLVEHDPLPHTTDGSAGFTAEAQVTPFFGGTIEPSSVTLHYRMDGGAFTDVAMSDLGGNLFQGTLPALSPGEVEYYISASNTGDSTATSPIGAPTELHAFDIASYLDDGESGVGGWTVVGDAARGHWELVDPIGTSAQPEDDASRGAGTMCWVTGQCDGPNCPSGCTTSCNDVDDGRTRLLSPVFPLSGVTGVRIKYERWFSGNDEPFVVHLSNDGGSTWTLVESFTTPNLFWSGHTVDVDALVGAPDQVQVRFTVRDSPFTPSTVEGAVDDFRILIPGVATSSPPRLADRPREFALGQNRPNPFLPETEITFSLPLATTVELNVYDVTGRIVRTLARGPREAGAHTATWDARAEGGRRVAAGVYFYRLVTPERTLTRKMTLLQ